MNAPLPDEAHDELYLGRLGERVRAWRNAQGMTRKQLAEASGVSERYLAQLEAGRGNISVLLLRRVARAMRVPVGELDREVEKQAGAKLAEVFALYGQDAFRRFERRALERVLDENERAVIATGGGLVTDPSTYELLLERCFCVWLKASPQEHMSRVVAQGDMRPFSGRLQGRSAALEEIRRLLADRERAYARAPLALDTSGKTVRQTMQE